MNIGIIIQARMSSSRLPGKILKPFYGTSTLLGTLLYTLHNIEDIPVIVATSLNPNDDKLYNFLKERGENVYRGSEFDVLERFIKAAETFNIDRIIRICSDNPFISREGIITLVNKSKESDADYIGYKINDKPSILTHFGFWGEFVSLKALKRVAYSTEKNSPAHEHVTYHIYTHPFDFKCEWIDCPKFLQGREDIRLTIDTPEDFQNAAKVYSEMMKLSSEFSLQDVVEYLDKNTELRELMIRKISENKK